MECGSLLPLFFLTSSQSGCPKPQTTKNAFLRINQLRIANFCNSFLLIFMQIGGGGGGGPSSQSGSPCSQVVGQPNASDAQDQANDYARSNVSGGACPLSVFQHLGGFPAETRESRVAAKEADSNRNPPVRRDDHAIQRELPDQAEQKAPRQVDEQSAVRESARRADLHDTL